MTSLLGLIAGFLSIIGGAISDHVPLSSLLNFTAFLIVLCGSFSASTLHFGLGNMISGLKAFMWLIKPPSVDLHKFIDQVTEWSSLARSQGTLALESVIPDVSDPFQKQGLQMIVDNTSPDDFAIILGTMAENAAHHQQIPAEVWEAMGGYSPTIGVMGAVMGLIHVMMRLDHPDELGEGIATAFIATVYGVGFANLVALPLGNRLKQLAKKMEREREVVMQGFMLLAEGKPGIVIRQNLSSFLDDHGKKKGKGGADAEPEAVAAPAE
ncbi:flagellar motor protein [Acidocella sp. KAb 2-4]|uniref:flagellar motor protein n=1 Tax=Acidocella sp. KAb 2-4 TaxID=2885158 RepID=UPI001D07FA1F|nr:flagellar motor protein [Acidocella sp. KAb 2-4]MCB5945691.1 flagellar motor protein [Acidocella sp. KAb 2-4]